MVLKLLLGAQVIAAGVLWRRLLPGLRRLPPVRPVRDSGHPGGVSILLPTLNEASYAERGWSSSLSPVSDPAAVLRVVLTTLRRPRSWRGREYSTDALAPSISGSAEQRDGA